MTRLKMSKKRSNLGQNTPTLGTTIPVNFTRGNQWIISTNEGRTYATMGSYFSGDCNYCRNPGIRGNRRGGGGYCEVSVLSVYRYFRHSAAFGEPCRQKDVLAINGRRGVEQGKRCQRRGSIRAGRHCPAGRREIGRERLTIGIDPNRLHYHKLTPINTNSKATESTPLRPSG